MPTAARPGPTVPRPRPPVEGTAYMLVRDPYRLRARIDESGLSFDRLGELAGVDPSFVSHLVPAGLAPVGPGQSPCPFAWSTASGPVPCWGAAGHPGRHARAERPRRRSCAPATADRLARALGARTDLLFEARGADDPSTGPLPVSAPATPAGGRHRARRSGVGA